MATVAQLETRARAKADQDDANFPTQAQYIEFLADGAASCWGKLIAAGWNPGWAVAPITGTGASAYTVGSGTIEMVLDVFLVNGTQRQRLTALKAEDIAFYRGQTGEASKYFLYWDSSAGLKVALYPVPSSGTYEVHYVPQFTRFTATSDTWIGPARSDDYIVTYAAILASGKEGTNNELLSKQLREIEEDMVRRLPWVDARDTGSIRDVYDLREDLRGRYPFAFFNASEWDW